MPESALETFVDQYADIKDKVKAGSIALPALKASLAKAEAPIEVWEDDPTPLVITKAQQAALDRLPDVFGVVAPLYPAVLTEDEVDSLMEERLTLDEIGKLVEGRKKAIKTIALNHMDLEDEDDIPINEEVRNKEGHLLRPRKVSSPVHGKVFSWEISTRGGDLDPETLHQLARSGELPQDLYERMTEQVRVVNETAFMNVLKEHPELVDVISQAVTPTNQVGSFNIRNVGEQ